MFRNPRENRTRDAPLGPSTGRAPSPPWPNAPLQTSTANANASTPSPSSDATQSKMATLAASSKPAPATPTPRSAKGKNGSILNFFKKADRPDEALFVGDGSPVKAAGQATLNSGGGRADEERFQENGESVKRRKVSREGDVEAEERVFEDRGCTPPPGKRETAVNGVEPSNGTANKFTTGPFVDESDSEDDDPEVPAEPPPPDEEDLPLGDSVHDIKSPADAPEEDARRRDALPVVPPLRRTSTSLPEDYNAEDFADFEGMPDFDDEYEDGEESLNRRAMQEQGDFEGEFEGEIPFDDPANVPIEGTEPSTPETVPAADMGFEVAGEQDAVASCPICSVSFEGVTDQEASVHVNHCLDGNPTPLPKSATPSKPCEPPAKLTPKTEKGSEVNANTFKRPVRRPRPGQSNPLSLKHSNAPSSAFSKLMSGHSEENAFAEAAASERSSHGKPSYQRTCPFYKILPGMATCVDAFRYGAVEGCNAYFLSHFHSDHYVGLTSSWGNGPIYCSGVTGRLVKQQLRVDPKWVKELEWEERVAVPNTPGVFVTMIPANHCPGSSIFLFEQTIPPKTPTGKAKTQRVLHCGDFRACPAHVEHPLLMPTIVDSVTGKLKEQRIDVCYLDTTYLNPKYAFPSQEDVIKACADMCVTLNSDDVDADDKFAQMLRDKTGGAMARFVRSDSAANVDPKASLLAASPSRPTGAGPLLVIVGTYSIGKERICLGIARALDSLIYAPPGKQRIVAALRDPELAARMTSDPTAAQVHMTPLFEIRPDTLAEYLAGHSPRFARAVAFRPSGWNFRSPGARGAEPGVAAVLHADAWKSRYAARDLAPQRGSTPRAAVFGVPYSEHSSFRELSMFCCALRVDRVIPTVNVGSAVGRARIKGWVERWAQERRKNGLFQVRDEDGKSNWYPGEGTWALRTTL